MNLVWDFNRQEWIELRPWMRWSPYFCTREVTEDQWDVALRKSVSDEEWAAILQSRARSGR